MEIETTTEAFPDLENVPCCRKNPLHMGFYNVADLNVDILPKGMKNEQCLSYIRKVSNFVVRLTVKKSDGTVVYGSGCVLYKHSHMCLYIKTNSHVVGSRADVKNCKIEFFYDSPDMKGVEISYGHDLMLCTSKPDLCQFNFSPVPLEVYQLFKNPVDLYLPTSTTEQNIIIISHPHGGPKKITFGEYLTRYKEYLHSTYIYIHTARTCPGSSGGLVINNLRYIPGHDFPDFIKNLPADPKYDYKNFTHSAGERRYVYKDMSSETGNINHSVFFLPM